MRRALLAAALPVLFTTAVGSQRVDDRREWTMCVDNPQGATANEKIGACRWLLQSVRLSSADEAVVQRMMGIALIDADRLAEAESALKSARRLNRNNTSTLYFLAKVVYRQDHERFGEAQAYWEECVDAGGDFAGDYALALGDQAEEWMKVGGYAEAAELYQKAIRGAPRVTGQFHLKYVDALTHLDRLDQALSQVDQCAWDEGSAEAWMWHAIVRFRQGRSGDALDDANRALEKAPQSARALMMRGIAQQDLNSTGVRNPAYTQPAAKWREAEDDIRRARATDASAEKFLRDHGVMADAFMPPAPTASPSPAPDPPVMASDSASAPTVTPTSATGVPAVPWRRIWPVGLPALIGLVVWMLRLRSRW